MGKPLTEMASKKLQPTLQVLAKAGITTDHFDRLRSDPEYRRRVVTALLDSTPSDMPTGMDTNAQIQRIIGWYAKYAGINLESQEIFAVLPERQLGFDRLIVVAPGMTPNRCYETLGKQCGVWRYTDDLSAIVTSVRTATKLYAVWCRNRQEADLEHRNQSANQLQQKDCLTLEERLLFEGLCFEETGQHLDEKSWTICGGSRYEDGLVPSVDGDSDFQTVGVNWCDVRSRNSRGAVRSAVSL